MINKEIRILLRDIRIQLNRNGLPLDLDLESKPNDRPDIEAIRTTIEREEKTYAMLTVA